VVGRRIDTQRSDTHTRRGSPHHPLEGDYILTVKARTFQVTASATASAGLRTKKRRGGTPPRRWGWPLPQKATAPILLKNVKLRYFS
jgi:hypothetical protein